MHTHRHFVPAIILVLLLVGCNLPGRGTPASSPAVSPSPEPVDRVPPASQEVEPTQTKSSPPAFTPTPPTAGVLVSVSQPTNCRTGPGSQYDQVSLFQVGQSAAARGRSPSYDFWVIDNPSGSGTCWIWGFYVTFTGDLASLAIMDFPATPTPPLGSAPAGSNAQANLVASSLVIDPPQPVCNQAFTVSLAVSNNGALATASAGTVSLLDFPVSTDTQQVSALGGFPALGPGDSFFVTISLTVSTMTNEQHKLVLKIDPQNQLSESDKSDNEMEMLYTLQPGSCP